MKSAREIVCGDTYFKELRAMQQTPSPVWGAKVIKAVSAVWSNAFPFLPPEREMERTTVPSISVLSVGRDSATGVMQVEFYSGWLCEAQKVPTKVFDDLMQSPCFDTAFRELTTGDYPLERIGRIPPIMGL